ncbi:MAG: hypothetical protein C4617_02960 [Candidatus Liberibacter europaeus]|uniref:Uncharacterized protein n=1 Tax=Candidatus Liberibacter europaeus TaxID=744859 RepID=A0A2T4VYD0_9HYPH|nr:MAG: hypothetical protein C4617_02960 [Candidatus Liberibacter europaeus]
MLIRKVKHYIMILAVPILNSCNMYEHKSTKLIQPYDHKIESKEEIDKKISNMSDEEIDKKISNMSDTQFQDQEKICKRIKEGSDEYNKKKNSYISKKQLTLWEQDNKILLSDFSSNNQKFEDIVNKFEKLTPENNNYEVLNNLKTLESELNDVRNKNTKLTTDAYGILYSVKPLVQFTIDESEVAQKASNHLWSKDKKFWEGEKDKSIQIRDQASSNYNHITDNNKTVLPKIEETSDLISKKIEEYNKKVYGENKNGQPKKNESKNPK